MIRRIEVTGLVLCLMLAISLIGAVPIGAQGYGGMYGGGGSSSGSSGGGGSAEPTPTPRPRPTATPTPRPTGKLSLSIIPDPATVGPDGTLTFDVSMTASGYLPGQYTLSAMALNPQVGRIYPTREFMSGSGRWRVHLDAGIEPGSFPLLFVAQDVLGNHRSDSKIVQVEIVVEPLLIAGDYQFLPTANTAALRIEHRSWWGSITSRSSDWFENLCGDIYTDPRWQETISKATKIDRDRLNITKKMAPKEDYKSYTDIQPIISKYWADGSIIVNMATANQVGNLFKTWKAAPHLVVSTTPGIGSTLRIKTPTQGIQAGNILNGIGATMILLDFWSNMSKAKTPTESQEAWFTAGYASLDMYLATIVGNTFGSAVALPGMMVSYVLTSSYSTLIGGHKTCWFKKMVEQAEFANYLGEDAHDTAAINKVKAAMQSPMGLEKTLTKWWVDSGPMWDGWMGGCGNWNLTEARDYNDINMFVDRLMHTTEVEVNGKKYHPWSFYYTVSRVLVRERRQEMAREAAENIRNIEAAYISSLEQTTYRGSFRAVSSANIEVPIKNAKVCPTEWHNNVYGCEDGWTTAEDGTFTAVIKGHLFSPNGNILMTIGTRKRSHTFLVPQSAFEKASP